MWKIGIGHFYFVFSFANNSLIQLELIRVLFVCSFLFWSEGTKAVVPMAVSVAWARTTTTIITTTTTTMASKRGNRPCCEPKHCPQSFRQHCTLSRQRSPRRPLDHWPVRWPATWNKRTVSCSWFVRLEVAKGFSCNTHTLHVLVAPRWLWRHFKELNLTRFINGSLVHRVSAKNVWPRYKQVHARHPIRPWTKPIRRKSQIELKHVFNLPCCQSQNWAWFLTKFLCKSLAEVKHSSQPVSG